MPASAAPALLVSDRHLAKVRCVSEVLPREADVVLGRRLRPRSRENLDVAREPLTAQSAQALVPDRRPAASGRYRLGLLYSFRRIRDGQPAALDSLCVHPVAVVFNDDSAPFVDALLFLPFLGVLPVLQVPRILRLSIDEHAYPRRVGVVAVLHQLHQRLNDIRDEFLAEPEHDLRVDVESFRFGLVFHGYLLFVPEHEDRFPAHRARDGVSRGHPLAWDLPLDSRHWPDSPSNQELLQNAGSWHRFSPNVAISDRPHHVGLGPHRLDDGGVTAHPVFASV